MKYIFTATISVEADDLEQAKDMMKGLEEEHLLEWQAKPWYPTKQDEVGEFVKGLVQYGEDKEKEKSYMKRGENLFKRDLRVIFKRS